MSDRRIVITLATGMWSVGSIIEPNGVLRQQLIERGFAKPYVEPLPPVVECAAAVAADSPSVQQPVAPSATGATTAFEKPRKRHAR